MNERLLQFIWQYRHFRQHDLQTTERISLEVKHTGTYNIHQGPDFLNARILIGQTTWVGHVELHVRSSDWKQHGHSADTHYRNIILHVVWEHDLKEDLGFPTLELKSLVAKWLLDRYDQLMQAGTFIPCEKQIGAIAPTVFPSLIPRLLKEKLDQKAHMISELLHKNHQHWEETFWHLLARNFGFPVNHDLFQAIATGIPVTWLSKYKKQPCTIEALLFGQAGLLEKDFMDEYPRMLQQEYRFLQRKHSIRPVYHPVHLLRMRPAGFPTIRLSQLSVLIRESRHLFSMMREEDNWVSAREHFRVEAQDYWKDHYMPDQPSASQPKRVGNQMADNLLINTVIPCLYTYGKQFGQNDLVERSLRWLQEMPAENNRVIRLFILCGVPCKQASDSQACLFLKKEYCDQKKCLHCAVGKKMLEA